MFKPFTLTAALMAAGCLAPLTATLAQADASGQGQVIRDPGQTGGAASGAARQGPGGTVSGTAREQGQVGPSPQTGPSGPPEPDQTGGGAATGTAEKAGQAAPADIVPTGPGGPPAPDQVGGGATPGRSAPAEHSGGGPPEPDQAGGGSRERAQAGAGTTTGRGGALSAQDQQFIQEAAQGGVAEVTLGRLAQQKAASDAVKRFGEQMTRDHSQANERLMRIAQAHGVTPPAGLGAKHQALHDKLSALNGAAFDKAYMAAMVDDHQEDIAQFEQAANQSQTPDLKQFAQQTLPTLREHLQLAKSVHGGVSR